MFLLFLLTMNFFWAGGKLFISLGDLVGTEGTPGVVGYKKLGLTVFMEKTTANLYRLMFLNSKFLLANLVSIDSHTSSGGSSMKIAL